MSCSCKWLFRRHSKHFTDINIKIINIKILLRFYGAYVKATFEGDKDNRIGLKLCEVT
jgi:hypothetical protein